MLSRTFLIVASGALMGTALLVLADGAVMASRASLPYNFLMWLPFLTALMGTFVLLFVNPAHILNPDSDVDDEDAVKKGKSMFFVGTLLLFASICLSVWKAVDPYGNSKTTWPGAALPIVSLIVLLMNVTLFSARTHPDGL
ncbi:hypothetical protein ABB37_01579 [Leptomonas pyrrhocoris]|uniref:Transmembrane protein n=1 Tax=Leptomonas pyrrhocoris TaxID=157538 RepID=A0A0N0VHE0_LEPPY|nr:hypothetical protein ABB37_01579 [Leptomonas pyrrhocoris]KPA85221.1 hypothetical protein ABB37_01579 [Leptomonas pyrrhocoris]|eukprot:XP_015663660.1 hypothetical protein ABB37_01579 [Leptomonas pyrrhocoris]